MGDERSGCGSGSGTMAAAAAAAASVVEQQQQPQPQQQHNFEQHLQQQQHIICGKCRGNNSTIWTIPCVYCERSRNFPFFETKINNKRTHTFTRTRRMVCETWNGKAPASVGSRGYLLAHAFACLPWPHKYSENIGWQITWISFRWYCGHLEKAAVIPRQWQVNSMPQAKHTHTHRTDTLSLAESLNQTLPALTLI